MASVQVEFYTRNFQVNHQLLCVRWLREDKKLTIYEITRE